MTNHEFITSFSKAWGTHPIAWMLLLIIFVIILFVIDFVLVESKNIATKIRTPLLGGALLLTAFTAISAEMSFATASEATSAR